MAKTKIDNSDDDNVLPKNAMEIVKDCGLRIRTAIDSLEQAQRDYDRMHALFLDAVVMLSEDPNDDFETALEKSVKMDSIESAFENAIGRLNFEIREAKFVSSQNPNSGSGVSF